MAQIEELELEFLQAKFECEIIKERNFQTQFRAFQHILDVIPIDRMYRPRGISLPYHPCGSSEFGVSVGNPSERHQFDQPCCGCVPEIIHWSVQHQLGDVSEQLREEKDRSEELERQVVQLKTEKLNHEERQG